MSKDTIYRQDAIDAFWKLEVELRPSAIDAVLDMLKNLPSAESERKTGHWVEIGDEPYDEWECDMCGFVIDGSGCIDPEEYKDAYNFCPNCGARMVQEGEDNDS